MCAERFACTHLSTRLRNSAPSASRKRPEPSVGNRAVGPRIPQRSRTSTPPGEQFEKAFGKDVATEGAKADGWPRPGVRPVHSGKHGASHSRLAVSPPVRGAAKSGAVVG